MSLRLYMEALGAVTQMVLNRTATIGICGPLDVEVAGLERIGVGSVELIPVAAPDHPLALAGRNAPGAGRDHIQLVLTLVRLDMREYKDGIMRLHAIYRTDTPPGPAGSWLIGRFEAQAEAAPLVPLQPRGRKKLASTR